MVTKQINFESEKLSVDYISFNIEGSIDVEAIANYFFENFGFNCIIAKDSYQKLDFLIYTDKNEFCVFFSQYDSNPELKIDFSGKNAAQIYKIIQTQNFDWNIFQPYKLSLNRFDLCYFREKKIFSEQEADSKLFIKKCYQKSLGRAEYIRNDQGLILRMGNNSYCIYGILNGLRFELEMKKQYLKSVQHFLFMNNIKNFEDKLTRHFYAHSKKVLIFDDSYTDWLIDYFRKTQKPIESLVTSYLINSNFGTIEDKKCVFRLFQFLFFSQRYFISEKDLFSQKYYLIEFRVRDFMEIENKNYYQLKKTLNFLHDLQNSILPITVFSENYFQNTVAIPFVNIRKKHKYWVARVLVAQQLYHYISTFSFPSSFLFYQTNYELEVKLQIIQSMSTNSLEKVFHVEDFLQQFNVSQQKKAHLKKLISQIFKELQENKKIKNQFKLITKSGKIKEIDELIPLKIGQSKIIYFYQKDRNSNKY